MADTTITSANSVFSIAIPGLFPAPVQLSGYSAERAWETGKQELTESQIGVDGRKTSGYVPAMVTQTISLQADSPSKQIFNALAGAMKAAKDAIYITGSIVLPSTGESFTCLKGTLKNYPPIPSAAKVLQAVDFEIEWQDIQPTGL